MVPSAPLCLALCLCLWQGGVTSWALEALTGHYTCMFLLEPKVAPAAACVRGGGGALHWNGLICGMVGAWGSGEVVVVFCLCWGWGWGRGGEGGGMRNRGWGGGEGGSGGSAVG